MNRSALHTARAQRPWPPALHAPRFDGAAFRIADGRDPTPEVRVAT